MDGPVLIRDEEVKGIFAQRKSMKRYLRITLITLIALALTISALIFGFLQGWHIKKQTPEEIASLLKPYFRIRTPEGKGPFPTLLCIPGAGGEVEGISDWDDYLVGLGYATILVDSYTGRGFTKDDITKVRRGSKFLGSEHAGDVLVALNEARKLPFVDNAELALLGWSHGAWAVMDLLAMDPPQKLPTNLKRSPDRPLEGVKAAILFYPYCGFAARSRGRGWSQNIQVLMLMGGKDPGTEACLETLSILKSKGRPVRGHVYPFVGHGFAGAFDTPDEVFKQLNLSKTEAVSAASDAREKIKQLLAEVFSAR
jgi:dienelactone hydrolase